MAGTYEETVSRFFNRTSQYGTVAELFASGGTNATSAFPLFLSGADPTGVVDAYPALSAAINAMVPYSCLVIPMGTYLCSNPLPSPPANSVIMGSGEGATTINTAMSGSLFTVSNATVTIANLSVNNTNSSNTGSALTITAAQATVVNFTATGFGSTSGGLIFGTGAANANALNVFLSSSVASAVGIGVTGSSGDTNIIVEQTYVNYTGTSALGFKYTGGGTAATPIVITNSFVGSTTASSPVAGASNAQPFLFRNCVGVNPVGKLTNQPAVAASAITNNSGCDVTVYIQVGSTATTISVGGSSIGSYTSSTVCVTLPFNQSVTLSQTTGVTWTWVGN